MPNKNEDLTVWHAILEQRNMLYENIKKKNIALYQNVISTASNYSAPSTTRSDKLFIPYTDIEWNKLKLQQQQRVFGVFTEDPTQQTQLFLDENFQREKQRYFYAKFFEKDYEKAFKIL